MTEQTAFMQGYRYTPPAIKPYYVGWAQAIHTILPGQLPMYRSVTAHEMLK